MRHVETIIVGGGPAGSTAARRLQQHGRDVLILDKADFPREKLCGGWITTQALNDLELTPETYPLGILKLDLRSHIRGVPFALKGGPTNGDNYSIRRVEFDNWLLKRSGAEVIRHDVKAISTDAGRYVLDDAYSCDHLIGAGGTLCPVRRLLFPDNRRRFRQVVTLEREFSYPAREDQCHLYFLHHGTKGYAWYVPKPDGHVNIGIGAKANYYKAEGFSIHDEFRRFLQRLADEGRIDRETADSLKSSGHPYYLYSLHGEVKQDNCYLIGDSAGLATVDMGEGIGPAIESALMVADEIMGRGRYDRDGISVFTSSGWLQMLAARFVMPKPPGAAA
ncbi:MAG: NAD(P)/FAD-dependent oxidoreductase [Pseudomonadota bacterium]